MRIIVQQGAIQQTVADAIVVNLFEGVTAPGGATGAVEAALRPPGAAQGPLGQRIQLGDFTGKLNEVTIIYTAGALPAARVIVVGLGKAEEFTLDRARQASATAIRTARDLGCRTVATIAHGGGIGGFAMREAAQATVEGALLGSYTFQEQKTSANNRHRLESCILVEYDARKVAEAEAGAREGEIVARAVNAARTLVNRPPNLLTPAAFAEEARDMAQRVGLSCTVLEEADLAAHQMGGLLAVGKGSVNPPRFVVLEHAPAGAAEARPLVFVGKGVTFDTGGISIKPADNMPSMKADMSGAAAVFGAMQAIAQLGLTQRVVGLIPLVENMPDGRAFRPGDVITMMSGTTVEVISTDAEGRLILADALHFAKRYRPRAVVDVATLTGACVVALGEEVAAGLFANDEAWAACVQRAAEASGERVWRLPLYEDYGDKIRSDYADLKNSGGRNSGVGTSAYFLYHFVRGADSYPWAHLDIAGMMYSSETKGYHVKGARGFGVRLLVALAQGV
ncbi:MAG: leucyl aminopeptidase [Thermoflexales bacterium]